jgi:hypothetical protein
LIEGYEYSAGWTGEGGRAKVKLKNEKRIYNIRIQAKLRNKWH